MTRGTRNRQSLATQPAVAREPVCLISLPTETLDKILKMAAAQDAVYQKDKRRSEEERELPIQDFNPAAYVAAQRWPSKWYGKSLLAASSTCKTLRTIAIPHIFQTLAFSKMTAPLYVESIKANYANYVKFLRLDKYPSGRPIDVLWLYIFLEHNNISGLVIEGRNLLSLLLDILKKLGPAAKQRFMGQITVLDIDAANSEELSPEIISITSNLRTFRLNFEFEDGFDDDAEADYWCNLVASCATNLAALEHLSHLSIQGGYLGRDTDGDNAWLSSHWQSKLTTLTLHMSSISRVEIDLLRKHSATLTEVTIGGAWSAEGEEQHPMTLPNLRTFEWSGPKRRGGSAQDLITILNLLDFSCITDLDFKFDSFSQAKQVLDALKVYRPTLEALQITCDGRLITATETKRFDDFAKGLNKPNQCSLISTFGLQSLIKITDPLSELNKDGKAAMMAALGEVFKSAEEEVALAMKRGDDSSVWEWAKWIAPVATRIQYGRQ